MDTENKKMNIVPDTENPETEMKQKVEHLSRDDHGIPLIAVENLAELLNSMDSPRTFLVTVFPPENHDGHSEGR